MLFLPKYRNPQKFNIAGEKVRWATETDPDFKIKNPSTQSAAGNDFERMILPIKKNDFERIFEFLIFIGWFYLILYCSYHLVTLYCRI